MVQMQKLVSSVSMTQLVSFTFIADAQIQVKYFQEVLGDVAFGGISALV